MGKTIFESEITRGVTEWAALPEELDVDPQMNGRHELPDIQWIVDSILKHGQLQPITIRREGGRPVLVAGFSRWRAVSEINKKKLTDKPLRLRCSYTALTAKQAFLANIEENRVRNATTPMDDAYNLQRLVNVYQMSPQECADAYRASVSWVKNRLALIEATPEVEKQIRAGKIKGSAAQAVAKLSKEHQRNLAKKAETHGKLTTADIKAETGEQPHPKKAGNSELLVLVDKLCALVLDNDASWGPCIAVAKKIQDLRT